MGNEGAGLCYRTRHREWGCYFYNVRQYDAVPEADPVRVL